MPIVMPCPAAVAMVPAAAVFAVRASKSDRATNRHEHCRTQKSHFFTLKMFARARVTNIQAVTTLIVASFGAVIVIVIVWVSSAGAGAPPDHSATSWSYMLTSQAESTPARRPSPEYCHSHYVDQLA